MDIKQYIQNAREKGLDDGEIKTRLLDTGWDAHEVYQALEEDPELVPPRPEMTKSDKVYTEEKALDSAPKSEGQTKSVNVLSGGFSAKGFEYIIFFITLGIVALSLAAMMHNLVDLLVQTEKYSFYRETLSFSVAALVVVLPIFLFLLLKLKKDELKHPSIKLDPSRRRAIQLLMLITFLIGVIKLVAFVYNILGTAEPSYYGRETNILAELLHALVTIGVAGGIFIYYWKEQSRITNS
jgi:hypothetical protein